jgi:hypothetical protein
VCVLLFILEYILSKFSGKGTLGHRTTSSSNSGFFLRISSLSIQNCSRFSFQSRIFGVWMQKQKQTEEEHSRKFQELQTELALSKELRQKLERNVREFLDRICGPCAC